MRRSLLLLLLIGSVAAIAPTAWSSIIRRDSIGSIALDVRCREASVASGGRGNADILVMNHSTTATIDVEVFGEVRFPNGLVLALPSIRARMLPGTPGHFEMGYSIHSSMAPGRAALIIGTRILRSEEAGVTTFPSEPTGCWDADSFLVL